MTIETSDNTSLQSEYVFDGGAQYRGVQTITLSNITEVDLNKIASNIESMLSMAVHVTDYVGSDTKRYEITKSGNNIVVKIKASDVGVYSSVLQITSGGDNDYASSYKFPDSVSAGTITPSGDDGQTTWSAQWVVKPRTLEGGTVTVSGKTVTYNGQTHTVTYESSGMNVEDGNITDKIGLQTVTRPIVLKMGEGVTSAVNAGEYEIDVSIAGEHINNATVENQSGCLATATESDRIKNYELKPVTITKGEGKLIIEAREIRIVWNGTLEEEFVYNGKMQGFDVDDVKFQIKDDNGNWTTDSNVTLEIDYENNLLWVNNVLKHTQKLGGEVSETLGFEIKDFIKTNAGEYQAVVSNVISKYQGENDAGNIVLDWRGNYKVAGELTHDYVIKKKDISFNWKDGLATKFVYNGKYQGYDENSLTFKADGSTKKITITGNTLLIEDVVNGEDISFTITDIEKVNAGTYTAKVSDTAVSGTNEAGNATLDNYNFVVLPSDKTYTIA
ncbi:MAG: hypothetical protein J6Q06_03690, partial [Clostridia bacterium]|nr:hypothetical protein [Clostridia bacterium]